MSVDLDTVTSVLLVEPLPESLSARVLLVSGTFDTEQTAVPPPAVEALDETVKTAVRGLLRWGGYKPSGRGRPASESLAKALADERWPRIHPLVDFCNLLSLTSSLPVTVLDADLLLPPCRIRLGGADEEYVFNPSGQVLSLKGLLVLEDAEGPTGSPVKDAQRTKVSDSSSDFLIVIWGTTEHADVGEDVCQRLLAWSQARQATCREIPTVRN